MLNISSLMPALDREERNRLIGIFACLLLCLGSCSKKEEQAVEPRSQGSSVLDDPSAKLFNSLQDTTSISDTQENAVRNGSKKNLERLGLALHHYTDKNKKLPPAVAAGTLPPEQRLSWIALLGNDIGINATLDPNQAWDGPANGAITATEIKLFHNPKVQIPENSARNITHYVGISGIGPDSGSLPQGHPKAGIFGYDRTVGLADVRDGLTNTMMLSEASQDFGPWGQGGRSTIRGFSTKPYVNGPDGIGGPFTGGFHVLLGDGSVKFVSKAVNEEILEALATINGGEMVGDY